MRAWLLFAAITAVVYLLRVLRRLRAIPRGSFVDFEIGGGHADLPVARPLWRRFRPAQPSLLGLARLVEQIVQDRRVAGVILRISPLSVGWAKLGVLRSLVQRITASGRRVIAFLPEGAATAELVLASAANAIWMPPEASIGPLGVAARGTFLRGLLEKIGVEAEVIARGEYKSAGEMFVRDQWSEPSRLQTDALLDAIDRALRGFLREGRNLADADLERALDAGPLRGAAAQVAKLVDGIGYEDRIESLAGDGRLVDSGRYASVARAWRLRGSPPRKRGKRIGLVELRGAIVTSAGLAGRGAIAERIIGALRIARADPRIGAVVLVVDSPGGGVLASDLIAHEIERVREKKPVVAYFSDVAASGGYMAGVVCDEIVAQPLTITGSIGVVSLRFVVVSLLAKLAIGRETRTRGKHIDLLSIDRRWTKEEKALVEREIDAVYDDFVKRVAQGRKRSIEEIEPLARGRVYTGSEAHRLGLVDHLGGLELAIERAAGLAKLRRTGDAVPIAAPKRAPDPPSLPRPLEPIAAPLLGDLATLALGSGTERLFLFDERLAK